ncbi:MAG: hypothetical protein R3B49_10645 [Phycisphaerales bacterium]
MPTLKPTQTTVTSSRTLIAAIALAAGSAGALAQTGGNGRDLENSLYVDTRVGGGGALDNGLRIDTRFNAPRPDFAAEVRFRNAIATGNAPGGLSFRGDVGYTAPGEFRGELGSDTLYAFRRDSLYSGLGGMGIRGTEALQYQFALTAGGRVPQDLMGSLFVSRDPNGDYTSGGAPQPTIGRVADPDAVGALYGQIRSPSAYTANRGYSPFLLTTTTGKVGDGPEQEIAITATPLRGIKAEPIAGDANASYAGADLRAPSTLDESGRPESARIDTAYDEVLRRLRERAGADENAPATEGTPMPEWMQQLEDLRKQLLGDVTAPPAEDAEPAPAPGEEVPVPETKPAADDENASKSAPLDIKFDANTMQLLHDTGEPVSRLIAPGEHQGSMYAEHIEAGERLLANGQYFDAEERFTRALSLRPGDVTSQIGRVHAQLGAGMFLSAGINLRSMLVGSPTVVSTRYSSTLLPAPDRIKELMTVLRENGARDARGRSGGARRPGGA